MLVLLKIVTNIIKFKEKIIHCCSKDLKSKLPQIKACKTKFPKMIVKHSSQIKL